MTSCGRHACRVRSS